MATRQRGRDEHEREAKSALRSGLSCDGDEEERQRQESDWDNEEEIWAEMQSGLTREKGKDKRVIETKRVRRGLNVCSKRRCIGGKRKKKWNNAVLRLKEGNRLNRSWFTEPDGQTAVRAGPFFFRMEWFFTLNGPWKWTVQGFPGQTIWSGPGLTTLINADLALSFMECDNLLSNLSLYVVWN